MHHIITYTESYDKSYVSYEKQTETNDLKSYVNNIKLCEPPGFESNICAQGDDGPENVIHAQAKLSDVRENGENTNPILAFLITDAEPHYKHDNGPTAQAERRELESLGLYDNNEDFDAFDILDTIIGSHDGKLIIVPIIYCCSSEMIRMAHIFLNL